uniref:Macaca fascicularis brain cDNA, clone: QflA-17421 n=1 Tax=Macaca fascicularis TaxID=9541 RepID=I7GHT6_MACFA|nr:unnamed protein product [Macaca fascicularis]
MVIFMLSLVYSLRNNLRSVRAPNRLVTSSLFLCLCLSLSLAPAISFSPPTPETVFAQTILGPTIFALVGSHIQIFVVSNTKGISPLNKHTPLQGSRNAESPKGNP